MEPVPDEVEETEYRNSDQDKREEERPIVVHAEKRGSTGLCRRCCQYAHYERHDVVFDG
jgi:hypothetical protein